MPSTGGKMTKVITLEGKMIMRLPSTGAKVIKMIMQMENGDVCDIGDVCDGLAWQADRRADDDGAARGGAHVESRVATMSSMVRERGGARIGSMVWRGTRTYTLVGSCLMGRQG